MIGCVQNNGGKRGNGSTKTAEASVEEHAGWDTSLSSLEKP